jgi:hypothetical protein
MLNRRIFGELFEILTDTFAIMSEFYLGHSGVLELEGGLVTFVFMEGENLVGAF